MKELRAAAAMLRALLRAESAIIGSAAPGLAPGDRCNSSGRPGAKRKFWVSCACVCEDAPRASARGAILGASSSITPNQRDVSGNKQSVVQDAKGIRKSIGVRKQLMLRGRATGVSP